MRRRNRPATPNAVDDTRMSFGDHLEELRRRVIWALLGLLVATFLCFHFGGYLIQTLTTPYYIAMEARGFDPRMVQLNPIESFMEYFKISLEFGLVVSAPWVLYQLWLFVAAGLYPGERRIVKMFAPASICLFLAGATFMVVVVLSGLMKFLIGIATWFPLPTPGNPLYQWLQGPPPVVPVAVTQPAMPRLIIPVLPADPPAASDGEVWINATTRRLNARHGDETFYVGLQRASVQQFVQPFFSISEYLGFVVNLALAFGLSFQIPILVVFVIALGIVTAAEISRARRYVILGVVVVSAFLTPTPDVATMLLLAIPMVLLFEGGLLVGRVVERRRQVEAA
jgi:sec-independent protein translocase protein TatC